MKILWLCNIMLPAIARELGLNFSNREGWLSGVFSQFMDGADNGFELAVCFPYSDRETMHAVKAKMKSEKNNFAGDTVKFMFGRFTCYSFRENLGTPEIYDDMLESQIKDILDDFAPDVIHIFGSEFPHALALTRVCEKPERMLLSIQGLCGKIADVYTDGIPIEVTTGETFRDIIKNDSIIQQQRKFLERAKHEQELFHRVYHVAGRTDFDRAAAMELNVNVVYHHLNESMRDCFYIGRWHEDKCEPYSIFLSQGDYPIKGFHYLLEAMPLILRRYPEAHIYVAGNNIIGDITNFDTLTKIQRKVKDSSYGKYIKSLIFHNQLEDKVTMLGKLDEKAMKERFLKSSVFVCPSLIENSPNAVGEAMLLGVPVVAAAVGGIPNFIRDGKTGLLYEPGNVRDLAAAIEIAWDLETAREISAAAVKQAGKVHNRMLNYMNLLRIYKEIGYERKN